jgi:uncharacterized protein YlzI (FlbEa/FlbD family)
MFIELTDTNNNPVLINITKISSVVQTYEYTIINTDKEVIIVIESVSEIASELKQHNLHL